MTCQSVYSTLHPLHRAVRCAAQALSAAAQILNIGNIPNLRLRTGLRHSFTVISYSLAGYVHCVTVNPGQV